MLNVNLYNNNKKSIVAVLLSGAEVRVDSNIPNWENSQIFKNLILELETALKVKIKLRRISWVTDSVYLKA